MGTKKNFIASAIKRPGALTRKAKASGQSVSEFINEAHKNPTTQKEANFAKELASFRKHKK